MEIKEFENIIVLAEEMIKIDPLDEKVFASIALCYQYLRNYEHYDIFIKEIILYLNNL